MLNNDIPRWLKANRKTPEARIGRLIDEGPPEYRVDRPGGMLQSAHPLHSPEQTARESGCAE